MSRKAFEILFKSGARVRFGAETLNTEFTAAGALTSLEGTNTTINFLHIDLREVEAVIQRLDN